MKIFAFSFLIVSSAFAGEFAVFNDGHRMHADSHENNGSMIRLHDKGLVQEFSADLIARFEPDKPGDSVLPTVTEAAKKASAAAPAKVVMAIQAEAMKPVPPSARLPKFRPAEPNAHELIARAAEKHKVPIAFVKSIMAAESNFDPEALSPRGAVGLMQLMPSTAQLFGADATVPEQNVDAGTRYLRYLMDKYRHYRDALKRVIAAYNAGPGMVDKYNGVPPFPETRTYVARVLAFLAKYQRGS